jgi:DNA-binding beta-propeller fold protein YncE
MSSSLPLEGAPAAAAPPARVRPRLSAGGLLVVAVTALCILGFIGLLSRRNTDPGVRVWVLNHTPDQVLIINPFKGVIEKKLLVADGLKELAFSRDYTKAYIANVVDVSNRLTVLNTSTFLQEEEIEVDGVPQGIGVFPDDERLAVILGSKTDFMAGGFDVFDLSQRSKANPKKKQRLYRERDLALTHKLAVSDDGKRIYCIDAKKSLLNIFSMDDKGLAKTVDLRGAPEQMLYPPGGEFYYVSVLVHNAIYQLSKQSDEITGVFIYGLPDPGKQWSKLKLRHMAVDSSGDYLYATNNEAKTVAVWEVGNPEHLVDWRRITFNPAVMKSIWSGDPFPHYTPFQLFKLKGGYDDNLNYVPGGQQIALDPMDINLFVVDEEGSLYTYDIARIMKFEESSETFVPEPESLVTIAEMGDEVEVRDMKVSRGVVRR